MSGTFYRGTTAEQDGRFSNKEKKIIRSQQWPETFNSRVDLQKVNLKLLRAWIERKLVEIAGIEDEVVTNLVISELEDSDDKGPDPRRLQINLEGFLDTRTQPFVTELWEMLVASQHSPEGIADTVVIEQQNEIDQKKAEIEQEVQRIREMMLKIQGKSANTKPALPAMPEISGKSAASQSYFKHEGKLKERGHRDESASPKQKRREPERTRVNEDKKKDSRRKRSRSRRSDSSLSSSEDRKRSRDRSRDKKKRDKKKTRREDRETKDKKKDKKKKLKHRRRSSSSSSYQSKEESSLSSD